MKDFRDAGSHFQGQWVFSIVNTGYRPLMVEKLGWRWRAWLCGHIHLEAFVDGLPKTLEPGDHASIVTGFAFNDIVQLLQSRKRVSVVVDTTIGQVTERVHPSLRRYLRGYGERIPLQPIRSWNRTPRRVLRPSGTNVTAVRVGEKENIDGYGGGCCGIDLATPPQQNMRNGPPQMVRISKIASPVDQFLGSPLTSPLLDCQVCR